MTTVHVVEHREILHIPGPGQQHNMETVVMHVASTREKAVAWIKAQDWDGDEGYLAVSEETVDDTNFVLASEQLEFYDFAGNLLPDQPCSVDRWYVLSLKHTSPGDNALTFWGPNHRGYRISLEDAGVYTEVEAKKIMEDSKCPFGNEGKFAYNSIALPAGFVNALGKTIIPFDGTVLDKLGALEHWRNYTKYVK